MYVGRDGFAATIAKRCRTNAPHHLDLPAQSTRVAALTNQGRFRLGRLSHSKEYRLTIGTPAGSAVPCDPFRDALGEPAGEVEAQEEERQRAWPDVALRSNSGKHWHLPRTGPGRPRPHVGRLGGRSV